MQETRRKPFVNEPRVGSRPRLPVSLSEPGDVDSSGVH